LLEQVGKRIVRQVPVHEPLRDATYQTAATTTATTNTPVAIGSASIIIGRTILAPLRTEINRKLGLRSPRKIVGNPGVPRIAEDDEVDREILSRPRRQAWSHLISSTVVRRLRSARRWLQMSQFRSAARRRPSSILSAMNMEP
jgi:hypothetical protein